jgi:single-strand DNA-binding protein
MARGVNKVILVGNLGADPEMKYTPSGTPICTFRLATSETFKDRDGNQQERTEWHRVVAWSRLAEICGQYLAKGRQVYIEGSIRTRSWDDNEGNKRFMTEVVARDVQFLGGGAGGGSAAGGGGGGDFGGPPPLGDDDIPF